MTLFGPFWTPFWPLLGPFWPLFGPFLDPLEPPPRGPLFGHFLVTFGGGHVLVTFWFSTFHFLVFHFSLFVSPPLLENDNTTFRKWSHHFLKSPCHFCVTTTFVFSTFHFYTFHVTTFGECLDLCTPTHFHHRPKVTLFVISRCWALICAPLPLSQSHLFVLFRGSSMDLSTFSPFWHLFTAWKGSFSWEKAVKPLSEPSSMAIEWETRYCVKTCFQKHYLTHLGGFLVIYSSHRR